MNTTDNPYYNAKIQKLLNKLISEEWLAGNTYELYINAAIAEGRGLIEDMFKTLAEDELEDHYSSLIEWANTYGYSVPCSIQEFERYASKVSLKGFKSFKKNQEAQYYIDKVIEAEVDAIQSYEEALLVPELAIYGDLGVIILRNYNDELKHIEDLGVLQYTDKISQIQLS